MQLKASLECNKPVMCFKLDWFKISYFSCIVGLQFFFFLSYQDPFRMDFSAMEKALFNAKMTSDLAAWPNFLTR